MNFPQEIVAYIILSNFDDGFEIHSQSADIFTVSINEWKSKAGVEIGARNRTLNVLHKIH